MIIILYDPSDSYWDSSLKHRQHLDF